MNDGKRRIFLMDIEEAKKLGRKILEGTCDDAFKEFGERPHVEEHGNRMFIVWPDGEATNELEIEILQ
jgi:hypothetical protein